MFRRAPLAVVSGLRETSVIWAVLIGLVVPVAAILAFGRRVQ